MSTPPPLSETAVVGRQPLLHDLAVTLRAPSVVLAGSDGQIRHRGTQGLLHGDVRVLSQALVTVDGHEPEPISHTDHAADTSEFVGLLRGLGDAGADPTIWLHRRRTVTSCGLAETLDLVSAAAEDQTCTVELATAADFGGIDAIKSGIPSPGLHPPRVRDGSAQWRRGPIDVVLTAPDAAVESDGTTANVRWAVALPARSVVRLRWELTITDADPMLVAGDAIRLDVPHVRADDPRLARLVEQSISDLNAMLMAGADHPEDVFLGAGAPWYLTLFGRDSIWAARLLLPLSVDLAAGTLRTLARLQGTRHEPVTGEAPGKIPHELRRSSFQTPEFSLPALYYGTIDATSLWVCLLHDAWRWGMPEDQVRALLPNLRAALRWITEFSDTDGDGFAEYLDESGHGLTNQGWKDSGDAIRFADGTVASGSMALAEVQGYQYEALRKAGVLLSTLGADEPGLAEYADRLATSFRTKFWVSDQAGPFPALALDGAKNPVDTPTSNIGHLLGTGLIDQTETEAIGARLVGPDMASGFGLRTMSRRAQGYSPLSYHCGSVWPHDTAIVIRGLARTGQQQRAATLAEQLLHAAQRFDWRLPELFAGYGPRETGRPVPYPASCRPQAWSSASAIALVQTFLGLEVDVPRRTITVRPPAHSAVGALEVRGLRLADEELDISIDRDGTVLDVRAPQGFTVVT
ncbi:glycogen debranching N-terminal domain-containing protein [Lentzea nigeriaca]|uniref:glycogen debranching N-terminal domain-containing protein n=1 Tax=Lentzea nigeriaca TaxID=1128665 RepID=UPI00195B7076|nr:glycogen debranching N-terminal domain-containing protein [Lentzea nigeriaca]MBM7856268.1 glycogen debranching enzyme [Lentzea nigeriaca]